MTSVAAPIRRFPAPSGRRAVLAAALAAVCGLGLAAAGITLVRAADDTGLFEVIRSDYLRSVAHSVRLPSRAASRRLDPPLYEDPVRFAEPRRSVKRKARVQFAAANARVSSRQTVCVRTCDGYAFPLGTLLSARDIPVHQAACAAACPGAETALYTTMPGRARGDTSLAISVRDGTPYARLRTASLFKTTRVASCSCVGPDRIARILPIALDPTLRTGDIVVDRQGGARVYSGSGRVPHRPGSFADVRGSRVLTRTAAAQVDRLMGTSQREAAMRAWERRQRVQEASLRPAPFAEVRAPAGSAAGVRAFQVRSDAGRADASGARIIVVR